MTGLATTWTNINPYLKAVNNRVSSGFPWMAVLRATNMEYVWSDYVGWGDINTGISQAMSE